MFASTSLATFKNLSYIPAFFIGLSHESYGILAGLMIADVITGVIKSGTIRGWRSIKSYKLTSGVIAKLSIISVPLILAWAGRGSGIDLLPIAKGSLSILILAETYSVLGNIHSTYVKKEMPEFDAIGFILHKTREVIERIIKTETPSSTK